MLRIDGRRHQVRAADRMPQRIGVERANAPQPDDAKPDARHQRSLHWVDARSEPCFPTSDHHASSNQPAIRSPMTTAGMFVFARGITGMIEQSAT